MRWNVLALVVLILLAGLLARWNQPEEPALPKDYSGRFRWQPSDDGYTAALHFDEVRREGTGYRFKGLLTYDGDLQVTVTGSLDLSKHRIQMRESEPSHPGMIVDGRHAGTISPDLRAIRTSWIFDDGTPQGTMDLRAR